MGKGERSGEMSIRDVGTTGKLLLLRFCCVYLFVAFVRFLAFVHLLHFFSFFHLIICLFVLLFVSCVCCVCSFVEGFLAPLGALIGLDF